KQRSTVSACARPARRTDCSTDALPAPAHGPHNPMEPFRRERTRLYRPRVDWMLVIMLEPNYIRVTSAMPSPVSSRVAVTLVRVRRGPVLWRDDSCPQQTPPDCGVEVRGQGRQMAGEIAAHRPRVGNGHDLIAMMHQGVDHQLFCAVPQPAHNVSVHGRPIGD